MQIQPLTGETGTLLERWRAVGPAQIQLRIVGAKAVLEPWLQAAAPAQIQRLIEEEEAAPELLPTAELARSELRALELSAELVPLSRTGFFRACLAGDRTFAPWPEVYHSILRSIRCGYCVYGYVTPRVDFVEAKSGEEPTMPMDLTILITRQSSSF